MRDLPSDEAEEFKLIKAAFMGQEKALVIKVDNQVQRTVTLFEQIEHIYCFCET